MHNEKLAGASTSPNKKPSALSSAIADLDVAVDRYMSTFQQIDSSFYRLSSAPVVAKNDGVEPERPIEHIDRLQYLVERMNRVTADFESLVDKANNLI